MGCDTTLIGRAEELLKQKLLGGSLYKTDSAAAMYRLEHSYRVANIGKLIAEREGFDVTETVVACLLHDISYCDGFADDAAAVAHGRTSARIAEPFLRASGLPDERVNDVLFGIAIHADGKAGFEGESTPFAETVGDADNIDRFDAYRIFEMLEKSGFAEMKLDDKKRFVDERLARIAKYSEMRFATDTATELWRARMAFFTAYCERLKAQFEASESII